MANVRQTISNPMTNLFEGNGTDPQYLAVRSDPSLAWVRSECERLWADFHPLADPNFVEEFSCDFMARFWELYLGVFLRKQHPAVRSQSSGPDFEVPGPPSIFVEATTASRGDGSNSVPHLVGSDSDESSVPPKECVLRITSKLRDKAKLNDAERLGKSSPYLIAVNLLFREAWVGHDLPLAAQATLGVGSLSMIFESSWASQTVAASKPLHQKQQGTSVETTAFCNTSHEHISALVVAYVNPFSSTYENPIVEFLHNPYALNPLARGWLGLGTEYWVEGGKLRPGCGGSP